MLVLIRSLIENAAAILVVLDRQGIFRYCSLSVAKILGYTIQDVVGYSTAEFVHPDDIASIITLLKQAIEQPNVSQPAIEVYRQWVELALNAGDIGLRKLQSNMAS